MFDNLWNNFFGGMSGKNNYYESPCARQEAIRNQILLTEFGDEVEALMNHYGISKNSQGQSGTTTLAEIGSVVARSRHRADAYTRVLNELYRRTGYRLTIQNSRQMKQLKKETKNEESID